MADDIMTYTRTPKPSPQNRSPYRARLGKDPPDGQLVLLQFVPLPRPPVVPFGLDVLPLLVLLPLDTLERSSCGGGRDEL